MPWSPIVLSPQAAPSAFMLHPSLVAAMEETLRLTGSGELNEAQNFAWNGAVMSCSVFLEEPDFIFEVLLRDRNSGLPGGAVIEVFL